MNSSLLERKDPLLARRLSFFQHKIRGLGASLSFRAGCRCGARPVHVRSEWRYFCLSSTGVPGLTDRAAMDPNTIIEALRGTMDPALREAAERQLNEVRTAG